MALNNDGHSSEQPFPQFDYNSYISGLDQWLGSDQFDDLPSMPVANQAPQSAQLPPQEPVSTPARGMYNGSQLHRSSLQTNGR